MWDFILNAAGKVLGSETKDGQSQFLELFKGNKQKEREFKIEINEQFQKRLELELKDREGARAMQMAALKQDDVFAKRFIYYLAGGLLSATVGISVLPLFLEIPEGNEALVNRGTDFLYMVSGGTIISFFFGSKTKKNEYTR